MIGVQAFCVHHTINVIRFSYEYTYSVQFLKQYWFLILSIHSLIYIIIEIVTHSNPIILFATTVIIDYPQHGLLCIYLYRMYMCRKNSNAKNEIYFKRNCWGMVANVAHVTSIVPLVVVAVVYRGTTSYEPAAYYAIIFQYILGAIMNYGYYKVIVLTPNKFLISQKTQSDQMEMESLIDLNQNK